MSFEEISFDTDMGRLWVNDVSAKLVWKSIDQNCKKKWRKCDAFRFVLLIYSFMHAIASKSKSWKLWYLPYEVLNNFKCKTNITYIV